GEVECGTLEEMPGVQEVIRVSKPYKLVSRDTKPDNTGIKFPNSRVTIGGAYKPRASPYSFQGLGEEGLKIMAQIRDRFALLIVTEAVDYESLALVDQYADVIQIGARNMQNFSLLKRAGRAHKPVLLKRGISATLEEFLMAAEYIMSEGNYNIV